MHQRMARTLFLSVAACLGLMAFTAVAAQAENLSDGGKTGSFLVNKEKALVKLGVTFSATQEGVGTLLVPGRVDILCKVGTALGEFHNENDALAEATFSQCTAWQPVALNLTHKIAVPCTVKEPIVMKGLLIPKKHEGAPYILLGGEEGSLATVLMEGPECPLTKTNEVKGSLVVQIDNNDTVEPSLLFGEEIQKLFQATSTTGDHIKFGTFESYIDGVAKITLTDAAHKGLTFGVC
jgi:hypothetical protein